MLKKDKKINIFIVGNYSCYITRINEKEFVFDFHVYNDEYDVLNIAINTDISIL